MRSHLHRFIVIVAAIALCGGACTKNGMGPEVRSDIQVQMETARPAITDCYGTALKLDRKLRGIMVLSFVAAASSGLFSQIAVDRDDMSNVVLQQCVVAAVGQLKLAAPQKSAVAVSYPLDFAPVK